MTDQAPRISVTADDLRRSFDQTFIAPAVSATRNLDDFLAVRIAEDRFAIRLSEIAGIEARKRILHLPVEKPELLGITGIRGRVVPVYSLATLLGYQEQSRERHWLVLVGREQSVGMSFAELEAFLRVPTEDVRPLEETREHPFTRDALQHGGVVRHVLSILQVSKAIQFQQGALGSDPTKE